MVAITTDTLARKTPPPSRGIWLIFNLNATAMGRHMNNVVYIRLLLDCFSAKDRKSVV